MNPYGENLGVTPAVNSATIPVMYGFTGRPLDGESGLYYYRARYYDPSSGRFMTKDPLGLSAGDTNLYRYVFNNPMNLVDPFGLDTEGVGFSFNANAFGFAFTFSVQRITDDKGNSALAVSSGIGAGAGLPGVSVTFDTSETNANTIFDLRGAGLQNGIGGGTVGFSGGGEVVLGKGFSGTTKSIGVGTPGFLFFNIPTATGLTNIESTKSEPVGICIP